MSRLTDRNYKNTTLPLESCKPYLKLGRLEDLEEQLGCPLEVSERAIMNGIYTNAYNGLCIVSRYKDTLVVSDDYVVNLKDYKKTWWLKEDKSE